MLCSMGLLVLSCFRDLSSSVLIVCYAPQLGRHSSQAVEQPLPNGVWAAMELSTMAFATF